MTIIFTICSNNYLAQASVLEQSLRTHHTDFIFFTILVDERSHLVNYDQLPFECIPIAEIEPDIASLMERYNIVELNTCVKPTIFQHFFDKHQADKIIYLDPDISVYHSLHNLDTLFETNDILLTPHIYTPIPIDGEKPDENHFLNHGTFNLGFIAVQKSQESDKFISWWKNRTYLNGYSRVWDGIFVDQLYINLVPVFFKGVHIIMDWGYNMAPWNLHERYLTDKGNGVYLVNNKEALKFYHFSSFKINSNELPIHFYTRFRLADRPDLQNILTAYNNALLAAGYLHYQTIKCLYAEKYKTQKALEEQERWSKKGPIVKLLIKLVKSLPAQWRKNLKNSIK